MPIGVFDSGVGGLTVFRALEKALPSHSLVYLGDTARVPYGPRSADTVRRYSIEAGRFLKRQGIDPRFALQEMGGGIHVGTGVQSHGNS